MSIDPLRYGLITHEYRYREAYNSTLDARYIKARELEISSNLDVGLVNTLITDMFAVIGAVRRRFTIDVLGTSEFGVDSFASGPPARILDAPELSAVNLPVIVTRAVINEETNTTTLELWG